eukprot:8853029-Pyramimonas_sp.AAC.1
MSAPGDCPPLTKRAACWYAGTDGLLHSAGVAAAGGAVPVGGGGAAHGAVPRPAGEFTPRAECFTASVSEFPLRAACHPRRRGAEKRRVAE